MGSGASTTLTYTKLLVREPNSVGCADPGKTVLGLLEAGSVACHEKTSKTVVYIVDVNRPK